MATVHTTIVGNLSTNPNLVQSEEGKFKPFYSLTFYQYTPGNPDLKVKLQVMVSKTDKTVEMISKMHKGDAIVAIGCLEKKRFISPDGVFMSHTYTANFIKKVERREPQVEDKQKEEIIE